MLNIFKESENLLLEPLEQKHFSDNYVSWLNNDDVVKYNSHGVFPNNTFKTKEYINSIQNSTTNIVFAIIEKGSNLHIGNASIQSIDYINSNADLAILLGDKKSWGKGYATEIFKLLIEHSFNTLNLHKVTAGTTSDNTAMIKVITNLNMKQEATLQDQIQRNNKFIDTYLYGLINQ